MKFLLKALLAATALIPVATAASAQDAPWQHGDRGERGDRGNREGRGPRPDRAAPNASVRPQAPEGNREAPRFDAGARADLTVSPQQHWNRGDAGMRDRNWQQPQPQQQVQAQSQPQAQPPSQRQWNDRRGMPNFGGSRIVQGDGRGGDWDRQRDGRPPQMQPGQPQPGQPQPGFRDDRRVAGDWNRQRADQQRFDNGRNDNGRYDNRNDWNRQRGDQWRGNQWQGNRGYADRGSWNRTWHNDRQYDWNRYRAQNRYAYRLPRYYAPYGWEYGYRRFSIGVTLSTVLWGENYWIEDPYAYRLPEAYGPYRWVRYYNDALLVDVRYGQVVDVVYDIFW